MIVDASALVAIALREPGWEVLSDKLSVGAAGAGAPTLAEAGLVLTARLSPMRPEPSCPPIAIVAYARFGKGRNPAALNFGDCLTYAVARLPSQPLLYVGEDFARTDLPRA